MRLDFMRTLAPESGLAREHTIIAPNGETHLLWSVAVDIGQQDHSGERLAEGDYPLTLVGACGAKRGDAFVRACGESVERYGLMPTATLLDDPTAETLEAGTLWRPAHLDSVVGADDGWCLAFDLATGGPRRVPRGAVDYPIADAQGRDGIDPSPSGAAAGPSRNAAIASALRELVERDAAMVAWGRQARLTRLDPAAVVGGADPEAGRQMAKLLELAASAGLETVAGIVPTGVPGADCVIAVVLDPAAQQASAGLAVCDTTAEAAVKAVQEALQVRTVLLGVAERYRGDAVPETVITDLDRARVWAGATAMGAMRKWLDGFVETPAPGSVAATGNGAFPWSTWAPGAAVVELTPRLPDSIQALGWHAVRVLAPTLQPLRMDERHGWAWNAERLDGAEARWGLECSTPQGHVEAFPHPFI